MTKLQRVWNFLSGLVLLLLAAGFFADPFNGLERAAALLDLTFMVRGIGGVYYYVTLARHMVGGKTALYRGLIFLDLWAFTSTLLRYYEVYLILYLAGVNAFTGLVEILRSREERNAGNASWKYRLAYGLASAIISVMLVAGGMLLHSIRLIIYVYAAGLLYKGCVRIASAFKRTAIVFIQ